jgi:uncharacterized membrane protein
MPTLTSVERFSIAEAILSFAGAGIAGTLWWAHRNAIELPCTSDGGCDVIAQSSWSHVTLGPFHNVPVALLGFLAYVALLILSMAKLSSDSPLNQRRLQILLWSGSTIGTAYSWYLQYIAHFRIGAFCVWCFSSALVMTVLFFITTWEARMASP